MHPLRVVRLLVLVGLGTACGSAEEEAVVGDSPSGMEGDLLVSAASSLTDAFSAVVDAFVAEHPGVEVTLNLAGSTTLAAQILEGAPVDVFAAADGATMDELTEAGATAGDPVVFARNHLRIAVPNGNPGGVRGLPDFARDDLVLGLCASQVPCGRFAGEVLARAGIQPRPDTREPNVRALLNKVALGELDAGIVYASDLRAADAVQGIEIPDEENVLAAYPVAVLAEAPHPAAARAFVEFLRSPDGREILRTHGFLPA